MKGPRSVVVIASPPTTVMRSYPNGSFDDYTVHPKTDDDDECGEFTHPEEKSND